jgi:hypothetical protein
MYARRASMSSLYDRFCNLPAPEIARFDEPIVEYIRNIVGEEFFFNPYEQGSNEFVTWPQGMYRCLVSASHATSTYIIPGGASVTDLDNGMRALASGLSNTRLRVSLRRSELADDPDLQLVIRPNRTVGNRDGEAAVLYGIQTPEIDRSYSRRMLPVPIFSRADRSIQGYWPYDSIQYLSSGESAVAISYTGGPLTVVLLDEVGHDRKVRSESYSSLARRSLPAAEAGKCVIRFATNAETMRGRVVIDIESREKSAYLVGWGRGDALRPIINADPQFTSTQELDEAIAEGMGLSAEEPIF